MTLKRGFIGAVTACVLLGSITPLYAATPWLHTDANLIKDPVGNVVVLRGVDTMDLGVTEGWYGGAINMIDRLTNQNNIEGNSPGWYPNVIRIVICPADSHSGTWPNQFDPGNDNYYNNLLRPVVDYCKTKDLYAIIDWHYVAPTSNKVASTSQFWTYMAPRFANDSHVIFELFNEPNDTGASETARWLTVRANMQTWINIVRTYAPNNLILVAGPSYSQEIGQAATYMLAADNVAIVSHIYPGHWLAYNHSWYTNHIDTCLRRYPVFMSEWGFTSDTNWDDQWHLVMGTISNYGQPLMDFREARKISNSAWVASYNWGPPMFYTDWTLRVGEGEMGGFTKDKLYEKRNDNQPSEGDAIPPAAPTGLDAYAGEGIVMLWWNSNSEDDFYGYDIYRSATSGSGYSRINLVRTKNTFYDDVNVISGVTYYYVVTAVDTNFNSSDFSDEISAAPINITPPATPTGLTAMGNNGQVSLNWNDNSEADLNGYNVYRSTTSGSGYAKINDPLVVSSNYTDGNVSNGTTYYYVVTAVDNSSNESGYSSEVPATPGFYINVETLGSWVSGLSHTKENGTHRALIFVAHVEHSAALSLNSVTYGGQSMTKVIDAIVGTSARAYVAAYILKEAGIAAASNSNFVVSWSATPLAVSYASAFDSNVDQTAATGATDSNADASTTGLINTIETDPLSAGQGDMIIMAATDGNAGSYTFNNGFTRDINQLVGATATGAAGHKSAVYATETPSATHSASNRKVIIGLVVKASSDTPPAAPTGLAATGGTGTILLNWNDNNEGDLNGYNVYRSTTSGSGYGKLNNSLVISSSYTDSNVSFGTTYYYVVTAVDFGANESGYSGEAMASPRIANGVGAALSEWWTGIAGDDVNDLTSDVNYPDNPAGRELLIALEGPVNWQDNYGTRIRGYLHPPADGDYTFWIASDANSELWLSTDAEPNHISEIAYVSGGPEGYPGSREWTKYPEQQSSMISLVSGQKYYIEVLHKESTGNDNIAVAWQGPGISQQVIDGLFLSPCCLKFRDFAGFAAQWQLSDCNIGNNWCGGADFNRSGLVSIDDLQEFVEGWLAGM